ncbi:MAG: diacylglycerol O-acyltransferase / wax synthase [Solirubrobacteraceae bacterium]|nr:diacylglycerol O-acyltransferase / wax synthase [Solirubrobacteraceae bacterium]
MSRTRLTALDASFLEVESSTAHMHVGWASLFALPDGKPRPTFAELRTHVGARLGRAPRYRQKLARVPFGLNDPVWVDDPGFDVAQHIRRARSRNFQSVVDEVMSVPLDRSRPLWELWIADRLNDGRIGAVGKVHHCMVDGIAAVELSAVMLDASPDAEPEEGAEWVPQREPAALELAAEGALARVTQMAALVRMAPGVIRRPTRTVAGAVRAARAAHRSLNPACRAPLNAPISPRRHLARTCRALDDLRDIKRAHGGTVNDVVLAAAAGGLRRFLQDRGETPAPLKAMVPVNVRAKGSAGKLGNRISFVFVDLPCDEPDALRRLRRVQAAMGRCKAGGEPEGADYLLGAVEYAPRTVQHVIAHLVSSARAFNVVVSNIPGPPQPLYMRGCKLEEAYPVVPLADDHGVSIGMTTVAGEACFGVYADAETLPDADALAAAIAESVDELGRIPVTSR